MLEIYRNASVGFELKLVIPAASLNRKKVKEKGSMGPKTRLHICIEQRPTFADPSPSFLMPNTLKFHLGGHLRLGRQMKAMKLETNEEELR